MKWSEIITQVRDRLQEAGEGFFSDERLMDIARRVQCEVAAVAECVEGFDDFTVPAGTVECALPVDCLNVLCAACDDYQLAQADFRRVRPKVYPSGQPTIFYVYGGKLGLYPAPAADATVKLWYSQRPPMGGMVIRHDGSGGATSATVEVKDGYIYLTIVGGSFEGMVDLNFDCEDFDTIDEVVAGINAYGIGWVARRVPDCRRNEPAMNLEEISGVSAFQKDLILDLAVKLPEEFQPLIELGTIYRAMWKDTEFEAGEVYKREYLERLDALRRVFKRRGDRSGAAAVRDAYGGSGARGKGINVFIP